MSLFKDEESPWISIKEFAKTFDIQQKVLTRYINSGKIKTYRLDDGTDKYLLHMIHTYNELKVLSPGRMYVVGNSKTENAKKSDRSPAKAEQNAGNSPTREELRQLYQAENPAKTEITKVKTELLRMELEEKRNSLISREFIESTEVEYIARLKAIILQTPSQLARKTGLDEKLFEDVITSAIEQFNGPLEAKKKLYQDYYLTKNSMRPSS